MMATSKRETKGERDARALVVCRALKKHYRDAQCSLDFENPFQLLIATMLSAQCTDVRVNIVTPILFSELPDAEKMANAPIARLEHLVKSTGFFRNKAKNIKACSAQLILKHAGQVPRSMDELHALPGVGRKTANCVLGNAFKIPSMVVDTHVTRLANRLGLAKGTDAVKLEHALEKLVPKDDWIDFSHWLISHGRAICTARSPKCEKCFLNKNCPKRGV
jgi:endonuclease-3